MNFWVTVKKNLMKRERKKRLNTKLDRHIARSHALSHEFFVYIYIYINRCSVRCTKILYFYFEIISNNSLWTYNTHLMFNYNIHIIKRKKIKRIKIIMNIHD